MTYYERNLPHWQPPAKDLFVTWRLSGSLPWKTIQALQKNRTLREGERFRRFDAQLDGATFGPAWLKEPKIAALVIATLKDLDRKKLCRVHAYVVMPNHVHVLLEPGTALAKITKLLKGRTAREANLLLRRTGKPFWQNESFDHWIRNSAQFERVRNYIERNPVSARLVANPEEWPWSSTGRSAAEYS
jgi:putative transposase